MEKKLSVSAIKNGTVIDHITAGQALNIVKILNLSDHNKVVTVGINLPSKNMRHKDLIKVAEKEITPEEVTGFAFLAPHATVNIIKNYKVEKKFKADIPELVHRIIVCPNPQCISNNEQMESAFYILQKNGSIKLQCKYCEKIFWREEIKKYNH